MGNASSDRPDLLHSTMKVYDSLTHDSTTASQAISDSFIYSLNQTLCASEKFVFSSTAIPGRIVSSSYPRLISVPSMNAQSEKLEGCPTVHDRDRREAQFALRTTDLPSWKKSAKASSSYTDESNTDIDPILIQHWAVVIYFPDGDETYLYEAWNDENSGRLQPGRARYVNKEIFDKAELIGTAMTSPFELQEKAKKVPTGEYSILNNNCQTWLTNYLKNISPELFELLKKNISKHVEKSAAVATVPLLITAGAAALLALISK